MSKYKNLRERKLSPNSINIHMPGASSFVFWCFCPTHHQYKKLLYILLDSLYKLSFMVGQKINFNCQSPRPAPYLNKGHHLTSKYADPQDEAD